MATPPGVSAKTFQAAIKKYQDAIGKEWVFTEEDDVNLYRGANSPFQGEVYSCNNHSFMRFNETIKDAIDPNGILFAGRCGIWPKREREERENTK